MSRKHVDLDGLYDIRALRLMVKDVATCYAALGFVHALWPPVPGEFDDYIARPKGNNYRSLHTAVIGPEGKTLDPFLVPGVPWRAGRRARRHQLGTTAQARIGSRRPHPRSRDGCDLCSRDAFGDVAAGAVAPALRAHGLCRR